MELPELNPTKLYTADEVRALLEREVARAEERIRAEYEEEKGDSLVAQRLKKAEREARAPSRI